MSADSLVLRLNIDQQGLCWISNHDAVCEEHEFFVDIILQL
jgi:hypothetical protein